MTGVAIAIAVAVALAVAAGVVAVIRSASSDDGTASEEPTGIGLRPKLADFHVEGDTATVRYDVPLPPGEVDDRLRDLLLHDAALVVREKAAHGLPIDQVHRVRADGRRNGEYVEVGVLDLSEPGVVPELAVPDLVPRAAPTGYDPLAQIAEYEFEVQPGVAAPKAEEGLQPFGSELELPGGVEASLRATGIDPDSATLEEITLGLLAMGGYSVAPLPGGKGNASQFLARSGGEETLVEVLPHVPGEHPELSEQTVNEFGIRFAERNPTRGLLITDKFSPYLIYEKERRNPKCRFITRERLQTFVDGFALQ